MPEQTDLTALPDETHSEVFEERAPRTVRLRLEAGESVPPHTHPDVNVVLHVCSGRIELELDDEAYDLETDDIVRFSGEREVSPHAVETSTAVVVFAPATE